MFYHIKNLQSTKTHKTPETSAIKFYHIKNLQSTKTLKEVIFWLEMFYHIKNLQSTKTLVLFFHGCPSFITLRIYKVLKLDRYKQGILQVLSH